jgi:hypothetical protein
MCRAYIARPRLRVRIACTWPHDLAPNVRCMLPASIVTAPDVVCITQCGTLHTRTHFLASNWQHFLAGSTCQLTSCLSMQNPESLDPEERLGYRHGGAMRADSCYQGLMCEIHARHGANNVPRAELYPRWSAMGMSVTGNKLPAGLAVPPNVGDAESGGGSASFLRDYGARWLAVR